VLALSTGPNDYFGERALLTDDVRAADVIAKTNVECLTLSREVSHRCLFVTAPASAPSDSDVCVCVLQQFTRLLGPLHDVLARTVLRHTLPQLPVLQQLPVSDHCQRAAMMPW
jgi:CRP-like cAMP-binding protein